MKKRKIKAIIFWIFTAVCMIMIFLLSSQPATESSAVSNSVIKKIFDLIGVEFSSFFIRKAAHATEFAILGFLSFNAVNATWNWKYSFPAAFLISSFYGVTDEIHQLFVDGRACQIRDMLIDSCGALAGALTAFLIFTIIKNIRERGKENGCS